MDSHAVLEQFKSKLKEYTRLSACQEEFVLVEKLQAWLRSPLTQSGDNTHADRLLNRVAYSQLDLRSQPIYPDRFRPSSGCCLLVFCILLQIGRGNLIDTFTKKDKVDKALPLKRDDIQSIFEAAKGCDEDLVTQFLEQQYRFCPARFDLHMTREWDRQVVIPLHSKVPIKEGGTASLWHIDVSEEFVGQSLREVASKSRFDANRGNTEEPDWRYEFALKIFSYDNQHLYKNETDAFQGLRQHDGIIKWLANFEKAHGDQPAPMRNSTNFAEGKQDITYNILLEFGAMDLSVYFGEYRSPKLAPEFEAFWTSLFAVADALKGIHNLKFSGVGVTEEYHGWHADIKPDNILFVEHISKPPEGSNTNEVQSREYFEKTFKLADPGFAKFVKKNTKTSAVPKEQLLGGTDAFGAPEHRGDIDRPVSQAIDIWSLGCVFSVAATWAVLDWPGVSLFQEVRYRAIKKLRETRLSASQGTSAQPQSDCFHDGHELLAAVKEWHKYVRTAIRKTDNITSKVLDLVENEMLLAIPEQRTNASSLCVRLPEFIPRRTPNLLPEGLTSLLGEIDQEDVYSGASERRSQFLAQAASTSYEGDEQGIPKNKDPARRFKTTHRSSIWPNVDDVPKEQQPKFDTIGEYPSESTEKPSTPTELQATRKPLSYHQESIDQRPSTRARQVSFRGPNYQDFFQALESIKQREQRNKHKFSKAFKKDHPRDALLTAHFKGKRDIIFLVDNAESMADYWYEATEILKVLVQKAKGQDENGMDLRLTTGTIKLDNEDNFGKFIKSMDAARPNTGSRERAHTDLRDSLGHIFHEYTQKLRRRIPVKNTVIIILTDGIWAGMENKMEVGDTIRTFITELRENHGYHHMHRPFTFQFVQFGDDIGASERLRDLDDLHKTFFGMPDVIDTEHSKGNINKMLLGSFVDAFDKDEWDEPAISASPNSRNSVERIVSPHHGQQGHIFTEDVLPKDVRYTFTNGLSLH